jgi:hypothetical protein
MIVRAGPAVSILFARRAAGKRRAMYDSGKAMDSQLQRQRFIASFLTALTVLFASSAAHPVAFRDFHGRWALNYRGNYGYEFRFNASYRAICILYLQTNILVFKGVYTVEQGDHLRINISEVKNQDGNRLGSLNHGFTSVSTSYFVFKASRKDAQGQKVLELVPVEAMINGNSSEGYFEPVMRLKQI